MFLNVEGISIQSGHNVAVLESAHKTQIYIIIWYKKGSLLAVGLNELWIIDTRRNSLICSYTFLNVARFSLLLICKFSSEVYLKCWN